MPGSGSDFADTFASNNKGWRSPLGLFLGLQVPLAQPSLGDGETSTSVRERADVSLFPSCHSGYVGARCEHADLLAVVAASQKKQAITALVVVSIVALAVLIIVCVLIQ